MYNPSSVNFFLIISCWATLCLDCLQPLLYFSTQTEKSERIGERSTVLRWRPVLSPPWIEKMKGCEQSTLCLACERGLFPPATGRNRPCSHATLCLFFSWKTISLFRPFSFITNNNFLFLPK